MKMILIFIMYALFASVFTVGKVALYASSPFFLTGTRMILAGIILIGVQWCIDRKKIFISKSAWGLLISVAFFNVFLTNGLEFWGLQYLSSAQTCLIYSLSPFVSVLLSYLFLSEKMTKKKWAGLFIGVIGFLPLFLSKSVPGNEPISTGLVFGAKAAVSVAAASAVVGWISMKKLRMSHAGYTIWMANALSFILGGFFCLITSAVVEKWHPLPVREYVPFLWGMLYIAIIHSVICYNIYTLLLKKYTVTFLTFAGLISPVLTAIYGWFFLRETVGGSFFLSLGMVFIGLFLFYLEEKKTKAT